MAMANLSCILRSVSVMKLARLFDDIYQFHCLNFNRRAERRHAWLLIFLAGNSFSWSWRTYLFEKKNFTLPLKKLYYTSLIACSFEEGNAYDSENHSPDWKDLVRPASILTKYNIVWAFSWAITTSQNHCSRYLWHNLRGTLTLLCLIKFMRRKLTQPTEVIKIKILCVPHLRTRIRPAVPTVTRKVLYNLWAEIKSHLYVSLKPHIYNS